MKNCEDIGQWIEPIRNHFWYCCQSCDKDEEKLKVGGFFGENKYVDYMALIQLSFLNGNSGGTTVNLVLVSVK